MTKSSVESMRIILRTKSHFMELKSSFRKMKEARMKNRLQVSI